MSEIRMWFGEPIFITKLDNYQSINEAILPIMLAQYEPVRAGDKFSRTTDVNAIKLGNVSDQLHTDHRFNCLFQEVFAQITQSLLAQKYNLDLFDIWITKSWATYSSKDQRIGSHRHRTSHYSFVYYPQADNQGNLMFESDNLHKLGIAIPHIDPYFTQFDSGNFSQAFYPSQTGNLIIFPSRLFHATEPNMQDNLRISISGDVLLTMRQGISSEHCLPSPEHWAKSPV